MPQTTDGTRTAEVEIKLPADAAFASVLRTLAAGLAARLDFTVDDIEDLRIAVSEAVSLVIPAADEGADLLCRFHLDERQIALTVSTVAATPPPPAHDDLGWQVLTTLTSSAEITAEPGTFAVSLTVATSLETPPEG